MEITLRKARIDDSEIVLAWRNEPTTIPWMGATRALSFEEHQTWFMKSLQDLTCLFFIVEANAEPAGQIRYHINSDVIKNAAKVSINIARKFHGKGIASLAFRKGSELVRSLVFSENIFAYVQPDNIGSIKAMENAGFVRDKIVTLHDVPHLIMIDHEAKQEK
ncbi:MAG: MurG2 [uncultured bacterium]|nr:MAG: MurG2 [uncultured bacterium]